MVGVSLQGLPLTYEFELYLSQVFRKYLGLYSTEGQALVIVMVVVVALEGASE
jgi:hypothetical protein